MIKIFASSLILAFVLSASCADDYTTPPAISADQNGNIDKTIDGVEVHRSKFHNGHMELRWRKGDVDVFMYHVDDVGHESRTQQWKFGDVSATVTYSRLDPVLRTVWRFSPTLQAKVKYTFSPKGEPETENVTWSEEAEQDSQLLNDYQSRVRQWCDANVALVDYDSCCLAAY